MNLLFYVIFYSLEQILILILKNPILSDVKMNKQLNSSSWRIFKLIIVISSIRFVTLIEHCNYCNDILNTSAPNLYVLLMIAVIDWLIIFNRFQFRVCANSQYFIILSKTTNKLWMIPLQKQTSPSFHSTFHKGIQLFNEISFCGNNIIFPPFKTYKLENLQSVARLHYYFYEIPHS